MDANAVINSGLWWTQNNVLPTAQPQIQPTFGWPPSFIYNVNSYYPYACYNPYYNYGNSYMNSNIFPLYPFAQPNTNSMAQFNETLYLIYQKNMLMALLIQEQLKQQLGCTYQNPLAQLNALGNFKQTFNAYLTCINQMLKALLILLQRLGYFPYQVPANFQQNSSMSLAAIPQVDATSPDVPEANSASTVEYKLDSASSEQETEEEKFDVEKFWTEYMAGNLRSSSSDVLDHPPEMNRPLATSTPAADAHLKEEGAKTVCENSVEEEMEGDTLHPSFIRMAYIEDLLQKQKGKRTSPRDADEEPARKKLANPVAMWREAYGIGNIVSQPEVKNSARVDTHVRKN